MFRTSLVTSVAILVTAGCTPDTAGTTDTMSEPPASLEIEPVWQWPIAEVTVTPVVADVDGDGFPDVVVNTFGVDLDEPYHGEIALLDGRTGAPKWRIEHIPLEDRFGSMGVASVGLGDVSGDGRPDIVYAGRGDEALNVNLRRSPIHAVDGDGKLLWSARDLEGETAQLRVVHGAPALVNLDDDTQAEIAWGGALLDHDGLVVWNDDSDDLGTPRIGDNEPVYQGGLPTFADLDGDQRPELVTGREAWKIHWIPGDPPTVTLTLFWRNLDAINGSAQDGNDGWPAVADLDGDGAPEVVLTAWPWIRVIDGRTGALWCGVDPTGAACETDPAKRTQPIAIRGGNLGGPATIADYDGDGRPEAAIAAGAAIAVYDFNRANEVIVTPANDPSPAPGAMFVRWSAPFQDNSSGSVGVAAFDFDGDGAAEAVAQDECRLRVYDGATGAVLLDLENSSGTAHEYPVLADVDGDGRTDLLAVANLSQPSPVADCTAKDPDFTPRKGVYLYRPATGAWSPTRPLWTQHTYHVTNADAQGNPPTIEPPAWLLPGLNAFRQAAPAP